MELVVNVNSGEAFIKKFCEIYGLDCRKSVDDIMREFVRNLTNEKSVVYKQLNKSFKENKKPDIKNNYVALEKVNLGNSVTITYSPMSQKYIDIYDGKTIRGQVVYIDKENDDLLLFEITESKVTIHSLEQEHCSYYGDSRGYFYTLQLI